jgi:L-lactate utilization protein LutC
MRDRIGKRLTEYRAEALDSIASAEAKTKSIHAGRGTSISSMCDRDISEDNKTGVAQYMDQSADFIRHVASGSAAEYADELRDAANKLKQEIMARTGNQNVKAQLDLALDKLVIRKVEDFMFGYAPGKNMNATTNNTVNIINSNISNAVVQITQSGKDTISKETAEKLKELLNSEEITGLPEETRLDVLDQADGVIKELGAPVTDDGKVVRGLKRLGKFISDVASKSAADVVAH